MRVEEEMEVEKRADLVVDVVVAEAAGKEGMKVRVERVAVEMVVYWVVEILEVET